MILIVFSAIYFCSGLGFFFGVCSFRVGGVGYEDRHDRLGWSMGENWIYKFGFFGLSALFSAFLEGGLHMLRTNPVQGRKDGSGAF